MQVLSSDAISNSSAIALVVTTSIAAWTDWTRWRIPNALVAGSAAAALMLSLFAPDRIGMGACLLGGLVGLALFLPLYALKGMAAGDVKLMAVIGMYTGPWTVIDVALMTCLIGGGWVLVVMAVKKGTGPLPWLALRWQVAMSRHVARRARPAPLTKDRMEMIPYGVVIAMGTFAALW